MQFKFAEVLHECIFEVLKSVLGKAAMRFILFRMERGDFIEDAGDLHRSLHEMIGVGRPAISGFVNLEFEFHRSLPCLECSFAGKL